MAKFLKECEYCGRTFDPDEDYDDGGYYSEEYCSARCESADESFRAAQDAADAKFVEMAYGPEDVF
jgi:hypothetical protein